MGTDLLKVSPGCHSAQTACQLEVALRTEIRVSLGDTPCTLQKSGFQCGTTSLPFIYIPGIQQRTLILLKGKDVVASASIRLPAKTDEEILTVQRALLTRVQQLPSGSYAELHAYAWATVGEAKKALEVLSKQPEDSPQVLLNNVIMRLVNDQRFQDAAQLIPHLIPEKIIDDRCSAQAKLTVAHVALTQQNEAPFRKLLQETKTVSDIITKYWRLLTMTKTALERGPTPLAAKAMRILTETFKKLPQENQTGDELLTMAVLLERLGRLEEAQAMLDRIPVEYVSLFYKKFEVAFRLAVARGRIDDQKKWMATLLSQPLDTDKVYALLNLINVHQSDVATLRRVIAEGLQKNEPAPNRRNEMVDLLWPAGFQAEARQIAHSVKDCHYYDPAFQEHYEVAALRALAKYSKNVEDAKAIIQRIQEIKDTKEREVQLSVTLELLAPHDKTRAMALAEKLSGDYKASAMLEIAACTHDFSLAQNSFEILLQSGGIPFNALEAMCANGMRAEALLLIERLTDFDLKACALINGALLLRKDHRHWLWR